MSETQLQSQSAVYDVILLTDEETDIVSVEEPGSSISELLHDSYKISEVDTIDGGLSTFYDGASSEFYVGDYLDEDWESLQ